MATPPKHEKDSQGSPAPRPASAPGESRLQRIARRAHEIYVARGGEDGKAIEDWLQAEREIDEEIEAEERAKRSR